MLEIGADQRLATEYLFEEHGYVDYEVRHDAFGHDRIAIGYWPGSAQWPLRLAQGWPYGRNAASVSNADTTEENAP